MRLLKVVSPEQVYSVIKDNFTDLGTEWVDITAGGNRICGEDILASEDIPGFDRSTVDGYAVRAADTFGAGETLPALLAMSGEVEMGKPAPPLPLQSCMYIPTGGMLPPGADAVIMIEDTEVTGREIACYRQVAPGNNIIKRGEDISQGQLVVPRGKRLRFQEIGLLASLGIERIQAYKRPRVGILSTGNEIVSYNTPRLQPGEVRDSNAVAVAEIIRSRGGEPVYGGIVRDSLPAFKASVENLLQEVDFLVISGGSSVGVRDFSLNVLREISGNKLLVEGIAIQPGKPTLLAKAAGKPVLGLPGHPVSALNIFYIFGTFILDRLQGLEDSAPTPVVRGFLTKNIPSVIGRTDYVRVKLAYRNNRLEVDPVFGRSGLLRTLVEAEGMLVIPPGSEGLAAGREVEVILWE